MFKGYYRAYVLNKLLRLRDYIEFSGNLLRESLRTQKEKNIILINEIDDEFYQEKFNELTKEDEYEIEFEFSAIHWSSIFITQYSYIEHILDDICDYYKSNINPPLTHKDLSGSGIERAKNYISKYIGIKSSFGRSEWGRIKEYAKIRNKIIHTGIDINKENKTDEEIIKVINKIPSISLDRFTMIERCNPYNAEDDDEYDEVYSYLVEPRIELNEKFLVEVIDDFELFLENFFSELEEIQKLSTNAN